MSADWLLTLKNGLPHALAILGALRPTAELSSVAALEEPWLLDLGVRGVIWDVDGTLMRYHDTRVAPELQGTFTQLVASPCLRHVIVSNCSGPRFERLGKIFPDVPALKAYVDREGPVYRRRLGDDEQWFDRDGQPTDRRPGRELRKPHPLLTQFAIRQLECDSPRAVAVIGDQYATDIAAANLAGACGVKVARFAPLSFPLPLRLGQFADAALARTVGRWWSRSADG